jgi:broad specificity phosphatase PhoE
VLSAQLGQLPLTHSDAIRDRTPIPAADDGLYPPHALAWLSSIPVEERDPGGRELDKAWSGLVVGMGSRTTAVITHAYVIAWMAGRVLDAPESAWLRLPVENASVTTVERNRHGELVLVRFNERAR